MTIETPFSFNSVRYDGELQGAADSGTQLYMLPLANRRHPRAELYPDGDWSEFESCEPLALDESIGRFVDQIEENSLSLLLIGYSPGRGCPNDSIVRFNTLWFR